MRSLLLAALLTVALLSGCVAVEQDPTTDDADASADPPQQQPPRTEPEPAPQEPDAEEAPGPHGEPVVTEGPVTSGSTPQQVPGAWARRTVTVTNDFGGAKLGDLSASISSGSILVQTGDQDGYVIEAILEARSATEAEAQQTLERARLEHTDVLKDGVLHLVTFAKVDPVENPAPVPVPVTVGLFTSNLRVDLVITVPTGPAIQLDAASSSGDITVTGLHGPRMEASSSSGDLLLEQLVVGDLGLGSSSGAIVLSRLQASSLEASTSSGDIVGEGVTAARARVSSSSGDIAIDGAIDTLEAGTSSGDLSFQLAPARSGSYELSSSSGDIGLQLPADDHAYHAAASTSSGDIRIDLPDSEVLDDDERHLEVATEGFDDARLRTVIEASTSSGDIGIVAE